MLVEVDGDDLNWTARRRAEGARQAARRV